MGLWIFIEKKIRKHFSPDDFAVALRHYELSKKLFDAEPPDVLVVLGDQTLSHWLLCLAAKSKGIKTVAIPTYHLQLSIFMDKLSPYFESSIVSQWAVLNKTFKEVLVRSGVEPHRVRVTGLPKFNPLIEKKSGFTKKELLKKFGFEKMDASVFLLTLQNPPWSKPMFNAMTAVMKGLPDKLLVARPHPFDKREPFETASMPENMVIERELGLNDLLTASDLVITGDSITAFEAILADKPIIILTLTSQFYPHIFIEEGAALEVCKNQDIIPIIKKVLSDPSVQQALRFGRQKVMANYSPGTEIDSTQEILHVIDKSLPLGDGLRDSLSTTRTGE